MSDYSDKFLRLVREHVESIGGLDLEVINNTTSGYPAIFTVTPRDGFDKILRFVWVPPADRTTELERFKQELRTELDKHAGKYG